MVVIYQKQNQQSNTSDNNTGTIKVGQGTGFEKEAGSDVAGEKPLYDSALVSQDLVNNKKDILSKRLVRLKKKSAKRKIKIDDERKYTDYILHFLIKLKDSEKEEAPKYGEKIEVSDVLSPIARVYEKIRSTVEYKGENLIRRNAIERILKRLIWEKIRLSTSVDLNSVSSQLIKELIWAKYLPNKTIIKSKINDIENVIGKYLYILDNLDTVDNNKSFRKIRSWFLAVASSEIEDIVDPSHRDLFIDLMYSWFEDHYDWNDNIDDGTKKVQTYLAIHRAFLKSDDPIMRYYLLRQLVPDWENLDKTQVNAFLMEFPQIYEKIETNLEYPDRLNLYRKISKHSSAFEILRQIVIQKSQNLSDLIEKPRELEKEVIDVCEKNYQQIKKRVNTGIVRSIIYIFITKVVFALLLEVPFEIIRYGDMKYIPLTINIVFPPLMMFFMGLSIKTPGAKNTQAIIERINSVVYRKTSNEKIPFTLKKSKTKSTLLTIFLLLYGVLFIAVFGGFYALLINIGYSIFGIIVFFLFLSLILLFAFRVKYQADYLKVDRDKEGLLGHLFSYLTLPFLNLGFYLSQGLAQINFFTVLLDFIIEAPLKNMIGIFEGWIGFIREKREEVIEIPER